MAKISKAFFCQNCGYESSKWVGKCNACGEWNTFVEEIIQKEKTKTGIPSKKRTAKKPSRISEIQFIDEKRIITPIEEFNRVVGGGIVLGSLILIGGEPGIGKSTLLLQLAVQSDLKVLYISGEESVQQVKMRAERIGETNENCFLLAETSTQNIFQQLDDNKHDLIIVDSIQTLHTSFIESSPGSISQIRECTAELLRFAKETNTPIILIGHITKDGNIAGPKILEHMVDTVLQFEGDRNHVYRLLRANKNRFGSTNELGIFEMQGVGLREVANPSEILISSKSNEELSGVAIAGTMEGLRPMLVEVQALVSTAAYGTPQRSSTGFDLRRLNMLLAVLEKRCGFRLAAKDVFLNIAGGIKVDDPAIDLAVVCAILSSGEDVALPTDACFAAEVGLSGEIRPVNRVDQRIFEAEKLGFSIIFVSRKNKNLDKLTVKSITLVQVGKIEEVFQHLFG